jgi:hypothetical protein
MIVTIKLTTAGSETGPFNLYSDADGFVTVFETNVSKSKLLAGYTTNLAPENTKVVRACSMANCKNCVDIKVSLVCQSPFYYMFADALSYALTYVPPAPNPVPAAVETTPALTSLFAQGIDRLLDKGLFSTDCKFCCPDCGRYVFASVETYLKYAEAVGLTQSEAVPS